MLNYWKARADLRAVGAEIRVIERETIRWEHPMPLVYSVAHPRRTAEDIVLWALNQARWDLRAYGTDPVAALDEFNDDRSHCEQDHDYISPDMLGHLTTD